MLNSLVQYLINKFSTFSLHFFRFCYPQMHTSPLPLSSFNRNKKRAETYGIGSKGRTKSKSSLVGWLGLDVCTIWSARTFDVVRIQLGCECLQMTYTCSNIACHKSHIIKTNCSLQKALLSSYKKEAQTHNHFNVLPFNYRLWNLLHTSSHTAQQWRPMPISCSPNRWLFSLISHTHVTCNSKNKKLTFFSSVLSLSPSHFLKP